MKVCIVGGARPNFVKIAPIINELEKRNIDYYLVNTGQHYDENMAGIFFKELGIKTPDYNLDVGGGSHATQTGNIMIEFEKVLEKEKTSLVIVVGDVNSTMACAITAKKLHVDVAHVEAGIRSFDLNMPEEINRLVTDRLTDLYLTPSEDAEIHLLKEGVDKNKIKFVGNIMIDSLIKNLEKINKSNILDRLSLKSKKYFLVTMHRPSNVDNKKILTSIINIILDTIPFNIKIIFPIHPRTLKNLKKFEIYNKLENRKNLVITEPLGYIDFQHLTKHSKALISDSGGIQEETSIYNTPCLTLRDNTERPISIIKGTTELVNINSLKENIKKVLSGNWKQSQKIKFWDGNTAKRIVDEIETYLKNLNSF